MSEDPLYVEIESFSPLGIDTKVYLVDRITGYRSAMGGVRKVNYSVADDGVGEVTLVVVPDKINVKARLSQIVDDVIKRNRPGGTTGDGMVE